MKFAKATFLVAGLYGLALLTPMYFLEDRIGVDAPPAITHPEYFYGFVGVALAWQILFLIIARDPLRHRLAMLPGALEKLGFGAAAIALFFQRRVTLPGLTFGLIDLAFGAAFLIAYASTRSAAPSR